MKKLFALLACMALAAQALVLPVSAAEAPEMKVHVLGIGQGDAIFIELPDKKTMLIDAANPGDGAAVLQYAAGLGCDAIDYLVATHPHADHIGGMAEVVESIGIGSVYMPSATTTTQTFAGLLASIKAKGLKITQAKAGVRIPSADPSLKMEFVAPVRERDGLNDNSAVLKITYGKRSFLFAGDAGAQEEADITADIRADVLKVGHHGSDTSTSAAFLKKVSPAWAVISVGSGNDYGHPAQATLGALAAADAAVYRTDTQGTVIFTTDGERIDVSTAAAPAKPGAPPPAEVGTSSAAQAETPPDEAGEPAACYWTPGGKSYHGSRDCVTLKRSKTILSGTRQEAAAAGKNDPCNLCAGGK